MGLAKYREDDMEIMIERQINRGNKKQSSKMYDTNISTATSVPLPGACKRAVSSKVIDDKPVGQTSTYTDKALYCKCCGQKFLFSAYAQKDYAKKGWCEPKRCKSCRGFNNISKLMRQSF